MVDIYDVLVEHKDAWLTTKEIMLNMGLEYENDTQRSIITKKLKRLRRGKIIEFKKNEDVVWGHEYLYKANIIVED